MTNEETIEQLRYRRLRIEELIPLQNVALAVDLLRAELFYVDLTIEYRTRHGGLTGIVLAPPN